MSLAIAMLFVGFLTIMAWPLGLRSHVVGAYATLVILLLHFAAPLVLAWRADPVAIAYANDFAFVAALVVGYVILLSGFTYLGKLSGSRQTASAPRRIDGPRLTVGASLLIVAAWTCYLALKFGIDAASFNIATSRSVELLTRRANNATEGSFDFLVIAGSAVAYFALFSLFSEGGRLRRVAVLLFGTWFMLQFASLLLTSLHRSPLIFLVAAHLLVIHVYVRTIPMARLLLVVAIIAMPFVMSVLADVRADQRLSVERTIDERFIHGASGIATSLEFYRLVDGVRDGRLELEHGRQLGLTAVSWIPRVAWEEKPLVSFSFRKSIEVYGPINTRNWIRTFTAWGEGYTQFGYAGIWLYSVFIVLIVTGLIKVWSLVPGMAYPFIYFFVSLPLLLRGDLHALITRALPVAAMTLAILLLARLGRSHAATRSVTPPGVGVQYGSVRS